MQQGAASLTDTLRNVPGITFQLGENGNTASGDTIFMRGFDTQSLHFPRWNPSNSAPPCAMSSTSNR